MVTRGVFSGYTTLKPWDLIAIEPYNVQIISSASMQKGGVGRTSPMSVMLGKLGNEKVIDDLFLCWVCDQTVAPNYVRYQVNGCAFWEVDSGQPTLT
jgi:hypothetical protein